MTLVRSPPAASSWPVKLNLPGCARARGAKVLLAGLQPRAPKGAGGRAHEPSRLGHGRVRLAELNASGLVRVHARGARTRSAWDPRASKGWRGSVVLHEAAPA